MRNIKRFASTALAIGLIATMPLTAFAAPDGTEGENSAQESVAMTGSMTVDPSVSITGLQAGDSVAFYKVLAWENGWVTAPGFESMNDRLQEIAYGTVVTDEETGTSHTVPGALNADLAGELGVLANGLSPVTTIEATGSTVVLDGPEAGLYMAIITSQTPGYVYNPVFVGADFNPDNANGVTFSENELSYDDKGRAKLNKTGVEKTADSITSNVGEAIDFDVVTTVPGYAENYTNPVFRLTDVMSDGLELDFDSVTVKYVESGEAVEADAYTKSLTDAGDGYVIDFDAAWMKGLTGPVQVIVEYTAKVTDAAASINPEDNTVTVNFSNSPTDTEGHGILKDRTNHYTFNIDGLLFGDDTYTTSEIIKVGVDANGNPIEDKVTLSNQNEVAALEGAKFTLFGEDGVTVYKNDVFDGTEIVSDASGHMAISGLGAGTYYLQETEAPAGYIACPDKIKIEIEATEDIVKVVEDVDGIEVTYETNVLKSYEIYMTIGNGDRVQAASYVLNNNGTELESVVPGDLNASIVNTQGVELPSTGGMGTTVFYVLGSVLVVGAGVLLVAKKRMGGSKDEA